MLIVLYCIAAYLVAAWIFGAYMVIFDKDTKADFITYSTSTAEKITVFAAFPFLLFAEIAAYIRSKLM